MEFFSKVGGKIFAGLVIRVVKYFQSRMRGKMKVQN